MSSRAAFVLQFARAVAQLGGPMGPTPVSAGAEGVPEGKSYAEDVIGMELHVVDHVIPVGFRPGKKITPEVILHVRARVHQEMSAVDIDAAAAGTQAASAKFVVKQHRLAANPGHEIAAALLIESGCVHGVHVVEKRT